MLKKPEKNAKLYLANILMIYTKFLKRQTFSVICLIRIVYNHFQCLNLNNINHINF